MTEKELREFMRELFVFHTLEKLSVFTLKVIEHKAVELAKQRGWITND